MENFDPQKYRKQASGYAGTVTSVNQRLNSIIGKIESVTGMVELNVSNPVDNLATNVIISNSSAKDELNNISSDLSNISGAILSKAVELDQEEIRLYNERQKKLKEKENNETTV